MMIKESLFLGSYGAAKLTAFVGPIWIATHVPAKVYGALEFALNIGVWGAIILGLGLSGSVPLRLLVRKDEGAGRAIALFLTVVAGIGIVGGLFATRFFASLVVASCCFLTVLSAAQQLGSIYLRIREWRVATAWVENLAVHSAVFAIVTAYIFFDSVGRAAEAILALLSVMVFALAGPLLWRLRKGAVASYRESVRLGFPMLLNGLVMLAICNSGRLYIGTFLGVADVAHYAFAFRISGVILVAYQLINLRFYNFLYTTSDERIGRLIFLLAALFSAIGLLLAVGYVWLAPYAMPSSLTSAKINQIMPLVVVQTILWVVSSMLEFRINRLECSTRSFASLLVVPIFIVGAFYWLATVDAASLVPVCWVLLGAMAIVTIIQILVLRNIGIRIPWMLGAIPIAFLPLLTFIII